MRGGNEPNELLCELIGEALAVCGAADPALQATLAELLDISGPGACAIACGDGGKLSDLLIARRMFVYAYAETKGHGRLAERLNLCIACLAEQVERMGDIAEGAVIRPN
jgi:hypothetical protein